MSITKVLTECPLFNGFDNDEIERILSSVPFRIENYPAKEIYTPAGAPCKYADFILEGEMTARMVETSGKLVQIDRLKPGTLIAPAFIFAQKNKMPVSVDVNKPTTILRLLPSELKQLMDSNEQISMNFIQLLSNINVYLSGKLRTLSLLTVKEKVARFLIETAEEQQSRIIKLHHTRQEIADMFGIQKFSLMRCLSEFEANGAIKNEGKQITILNSDKLK